MIYYDRGGLVVRSAVEGDIAPIVNAIRREDAEEVLAEGCASVEDALARSFAASTLRVTIERDGVPVGMYGLVPDSLGGPRARVWLLGADGLAAIPVKFVRISRLVIAEMLTAYPLLYNRVDNRYAKTIRWLKSCGAHFFPPVPFGPDGQLFTTFIIRRA